MNTFRSIVQRLALSAPCLLLIASISAAELTWREHLDRGLLQEELHQDLDKAIEHYQANVNAFDAQKTVIAMSLYRLAECYRKLGQMDRATPLYARVTREFSDQGSLVMMSQRFVPAEESALQSGGAQNGTDPASLLKFLTLASPDQVMVALAQDTHDTVASDLLKRLHESESRLATMKSRFGDGHPEVLSEQANIKSIREQMASHAQFALDYYRSRLEAVDPNSTVAKARPSSNPKRLDDHPETLRALIIELEQMSPDKALGLLLTETQVRISESLVEQIESDLANLANTRNRYKPTHPKVIATQRDIADNKLALQAEVQKAIEQLKIKLKILEKAPTYSPSSDIEGGNTGKETKMLQELRKLVIEGPDLLGIPNSNGRTPIHDAAADGFQRAIQFLLEQGININTPDKEGRTALHYAAEQGNFQLLNFLLAQDQIDVDSQTPYHSTPLHIAAESGFLKIVQALVSAGANVNAASNLKHEFSRPNGRRHAASFRRGIPTRIKIGFSAEDDFKEVYPYFASQGNTPLHLSTQKGYLAISKYLIDHGVNVNATNRCGLTPLLNHLAHARLPMKDHITTVKLLLESGANPNTMGSVIENIGFPNTQGPIKSTYFRARQRYSHNLGNLSPENPFHNIEAATPLPIGWTSPLHVAILMNDEITQLLIEHRGNINLKNYRGSTPFHVLTKHSHPSTFRTKLFRPSPGNDQFTFDPLLRDITGYRATDFAIIFGRNLDYARQAIKQIPLQEKDRFAMETFWTFLIRGRVEPQSLEFFAELLQEHPQIVNAPGPTETIPLEHALLRRVSPELGHWLLEHGSNHRLTDKLQRLRTQIEAGEYEFKEKADEMMAILNKLEPARED